jgi:hypothetical protein
MAIKTAAHHGDWSCSRLCHRRRRCRRRMITDSSLDTKCHRHVAQSVPVWATSRSSSPGPACNCAALRSHTHSIAGMAAQCQGQSGATLRVAGHPQATYVLVVLDVGHVAHDKVALKHGEDHDADKEADGKDHGEHQVDRVEDGVVFECLQEAGQVEAHTPDHEAAATQQLVVEQEQNKVLLIAPTDAIVDEWA